MSGDAQPPTGSGDLPALAERIAQLERQLEENRQAHRDEVTALLTKVEQLAALATDLAQTRATVGTISDDLDDIAQRLAGIEDALKDKQAAAGPGTPVVWHELEQSQVNALWPKFTQWVVWLADTYELTVNQLPRCWHRHSNLVQELTDLWTAWQSAHNTAKGDAGSAGYLWQDALGRALDRFTTKWLGQCLNGSHQPRDRQPWGSDAAYRAEFSTPPNGVDEPTPSPAPQRPATIFDPDPAPPARPPFPPPPPPPESTAYD